MLRRNGPVVRADCSAIAVSTAGERSDDQCQVAVDTGQQQGFISDTDVSRTLSTLSSEKPVECVWILHAPIGFRVSHTAQDCQLSEVKPWFHVKIRLF